MWKDTEPPTGIPVAAAVNNKVFVAYYCDAGFYILNYDNVLGVMRKEFLDGVTCWTELKLPRLDSEAV